MERFTIRIAGRVVSVTALFASTREYCNAYLCEAEPDFSVLLTPQDIAFEQSVTDLERTVESLPVISMDDALLERTALQRKIAEKLFEYDTLLFHGSVISVDGEAYLFTAKSGTGKSTHTRLWRKVLGDRAVMVNDDKPFLVAKEDAILACGSPWNGKHGLGNNLVVPLKAICILERGEQNKIHRISANEALPMLLQQSNRPRMPMLLSKYMELLEKIADKIAFYRLECNISLDAAMVSYQAMSGCAKEN